MTSDLSPSILTVTPEARALIVDARADEIDAGTLALWLEVSGSRAGKFSYDMYFQVASDAKPADTVVRHDDFDVVIPAASVEQLHGATLDVASDGSGMVILNPNEPSSPPMGVAQGDLTGPVAQQVQQILERQINPSIASHGGFAELVAVEGDTVFLRMGGGCQGCGMAKVTLSQGIEVAIVEAVSEITRVVDVTDHSVGDNPYYQAAKK